MSGVDYVVIARILFVSLLKWALGIRGWCIRCVNKGFLGMSTFYYFYHAIASIRLAVLNCARLTSPPPHTHTHCVRVPIKLARLAAAVTLGGHYGRPVGHCLDEN